MKNEIINVAEVLENAKKIIGIPLNYKTLTERLHIEYMPCVSQKKGQLANLACYISYEITKKPTRYTIKEIYDEPKIRYNGNCRPELKAELLKLCERRYVDIVGELPEIITLNDSFNKDDEENGRAEKKAGVAKQNNLKLVKIIEGERYSEMRIEGDYIYIPPYESVTKAEKAQIVSLIQEILPYKHSDDLWDKAADYMRDWKYNLHILNSQSDSSSIKQYDESGKLIAKYKNFNEIKNAIAKGNAFGFNWTIGE